MGNKYHQELEMLVRPSSLSSPCSALTSHLASLPDLIIVCCQRTHEQAEVPEFKWASHHTWHSWRDRYKNNRAMFDETIARIATELLPYRNERGGDNRSRQYKALRNMRIDEEEEREDEGEEAVAAGGGSEEVEEERWEEEGSEEEHGAEENWEIPVHKYYQNDSSARRNKSNDRMPPSKTHDTSGNPKPELEIMGADGYSAMS